MIDDRRTLLKWLITGAGIAALDAVAGPSTKIAHTKTFNVVVVGGGFAGATFARTLKRLMPNTAITLIEEYPEYFSGPLSAEYLVGKRSEETLTFDYTKLISEGINVVHERALTIDSAKRVVETEQSTYRYDRCIVAAGISFDFEYIKGYSKALADVFPHAWKGKEQLSNLKNQLDEMPNGGTVLMSSPNTEYRCPPGPYERVSQIAEYLKAHKPNSKIIFLDSKERFPKQAQFELAWKQLYGYGTAKSIITWIGAQQGGTVTELRADTRELVCQAGIFKGDVINIIPRQKADLFTDANGLTGDNGWCPVNTQTFESLKIPNVHVIGDAADAHSLPKSAFAATCQARVCALAVYSLFNKLPPMTPEYMNVCFSLCATHYAISVTVSYRQNPQTNKIDVISTNITPLDAPKTQYISEVQSAYAMFNSMVIGAFG
ncbi:MULTISPECIES: FAD-dependent oxidoreductase [Pseudomonas]|uniref:Cytochrome C n=1 Tax=Pseudomonas palleroniana TaxID=191390 RepID=A0A1H5B393_9PSED|nr:MULTISPECIES: FAD-dependent oxidoreductase [Pseudomonas]KAB0567610.1 cytochrome C [Pseudomonas palleroniana]MBM9488116.1 FAD-dependent oxidoreductase [Pseudomonas sp. ICBG1301]NCE84249.1 cytochrome C [Pseudomonas sp. Q1]PTC24436.1 cytochrome C [Pseudomonas palleroniana]SED49169.1 sulfide dehydrogenase (flavocytochrome c), flavoprotein subunit [Pseudomonas palleroniana]